MARMTLKKYKKMVEEQGRALLDSIAAIAVGDLDAEIEIPEGVDILTDLAIGLTYLTDDLRELMAEQEKARTELEKRVSERTRELEEALEEMQAIQRRYVREQWEGYASETSAVLPTGEVSSTPEWTSALESALEQERIVTRGDGENSASLAVPISYADEIIGVLGFTAEEMAQWSEEDIRSVETIVEQVGLALENQRLFEQTQEALNETQATHQKYMRQEWQRYVEEIEEESEDEISAPQKELEPWLSAMNKAVEKGESAVVADNSDTVLAMPVNYAGELIGVLGFSGHEQSQWNNSDVEAVELIGEQLGLALENQRLFDQTQVALTETQMLYDINAQLNAATTLEELLEAAALPAIKSEVQNVDLYLFDLDASGEPVTMTLAASWANRGDSVMPLGTQFKLADYPLAQDVLLKDSIGPLLISDTSSDERIDEAARAIFQQTQAPSVALIPLQYGDRGLGLIAAVWDTPYQFSRREYPIYQSVATQTAIALSNRLLLEQIQDRAAQLEKLSQMETALSQANTEEDIIRAVAGALATDSVKPDGTLTYLSERQSDGALMVDFTAIVQDDSFQIIPIPPQGMELDKLPVAQLWQEEPGKIIFVADVMKDPRADETLRQQAQQRNWRSLIQLPLRSAGRWQGLLSYSWPDPHELTAAEEFLFNRLTEPIAAIVASRRAFLAQQDALAETETLYKASAELNATLSYEQILTALRNHTILGQGSHMNTFLLFDSPPKEGEQPGWARVAASWTDEPQEVPTRLYLPEMPTINKFVNPNNPLIIEDLEAQLEADDEATRRLVKENQIKSIIILPLTTGRQWFGLLYVAYPHPIQIAEDETRRLTALTSQATVVAQSIRLLEEAQARARREQILREITTKVRSAVDVEAIMKTAVEEVGRTLQRQTFVYLHDSQQEQAPVKKNGA